MGRGSFINKARVRFLRLVAMSTTPAPPLTSPSPTAAPPPSPPPSLTANELKNPGEYEEIGKRLKGDCSLLLLLATLLFLENVLPNNFDGCKFILQKGLSQRFQTSHTITLGSSTVPSQWQFGATYVGSKKVAENDVRLKER